MKKSILIIVMLSIIVSAFAQVLFSGKRKKEHNKHFTVQGEMVYYDSKPFAKYQAKTYSLDDGELVEEYNLLLMCNNLESKQLIGDLIDFVSDRHKGAEVEVEIDPKIGLFNL